MTVTFRKGVDSPLTGATKLRFGAGWDRKTVKPTGWKAAQGDDNALLSFVRQHAGF